MYIHTILGWRPRRTILFASWDAEEFGLLGSTEWAEVSLIVCYNIYFPNETAVRVKFSMM